MSTKPKRHRIELRLRELLQLFNSLDPSPFVERDLDANAEEFIVGWAREVPKRQELELVIHLAAAPESERAASVEDAVQRYFSARVLAKRREIRELMRRGWRSLAVGLGFLALCLFLGEILVSRFGGTLTTFVAESLTIGGWVAMWRPMEIYLYGWWPLVAERRNFERLSRMAVKLVLPVGGEGGRK